MHRHHATRPQTDAWLAAGDFDRVGSEVAKLTRLLEVLDEIAIAGAPSLDVAGHLVLERGTLGSRVLSK